jgi:hypothetical protein
MNMDPVMDAHLKDWAAFTSLLGLTIWCPYMIGAAFRRRQQNQMLKHMLDKFSSAQDFAAFMQSPAGQKYLTSFTETAASPRNTILGAVRTGFVLMFGGAGAIVGIADPVSWRVGSVAMLAGVGFLFSATVSYFLAKRIGAAEQG